MAVIDGGREKLQREVAVGHGIERIGARPVEPQRLRRHLPVDGKGRARQRSRAKGAFVHPHAGIAEPRRVAAEHLDIGHHVVAPGHRLRGLQMGEARHDPVGAGLGLASSARCSDSSPTIAASV
jgi:hypothetical protein